MKNILMFLPLALLAPPASATALLPGEAASGQKLHTGQCQSCHDSSVYTRTNRRVKTVEGLIKQVNVCNTQLNKKLNRDQINDLVRYLNEAYYRFD